MAKTIALVAHDGQKPQLIDWARGHKDQLTRHVLFATGTTGGRLEDELGLGITRLMSGPKGGDAQLGAMIAEGKLDALIFFIDPMTALPHDVDVKSLLRLAILYNTPLAVNAASADAVIAAFAQA